uniref:Pleckstrin homology domain-containing family A member 8 n=1 Tax=Crassostrea virginica TaxID=6565 RepID=A0A8B8CVJ9_CRAVI|nr:pleckstrin homology domain-containing family A member 3-like isoform X2 [Crassostrea virginica]
MEGVLLKWTNYLTGWQPRWFVLDNGNLSYYKSEEEVNLGCKGSIRMAVCDINVHSTDKCRLDLIIPGESHFYLRASNPQERQQWLVSLGTAKASLTNGRIKKSADEVSPDIIKTKKSELRLYCDLLMQQVHSVKSVAQSGNPVDLEKLNEATSLLGPTCDTFISTLEDCMKIANASKAYDSPHQHISDSPFPMIKLKPPQKKDSRSYSVSDKYSPTASSRRRTLSDSSPEKLSPRSRSAMSLSTQPQVNETSESDDAPVSKTADDKPLFSEENSSNEILKRSASLKSLENGDEEFKDAIDEKIPNFFSTMQSSFMDLQLEADGGISIEHFLSACRCLVPIFDKLNGTAFAPVKMDFQGNIRKIQQKYSTNPSSFTTLQTMVLTEVDCKHHRISSSATVALLWMKRGLQFIREFLKEILNNQQDLSLAASNAYSRSLKPFHGWVVRGVFAVAVKALPSMLCSSPFSPLELFMLYIVFVAGGSEGLIKHAVFIPLFSPGIVYVVYCFCGRWQ